MPNRNQSSDQGTPQAKSRQRRKQVQSDTPEAQQDDPGRVEIGDPVPEDDRTIRAGDEMGQDRGQGETGEDEDLPEDDGNVERGPRH